VGLVLLDRVEDERVVEVAMMSRTSRRRPGGPAASLREPLAALDELLVLGGVGDVLDDDLSR